MTVTKIGPQTLGATLPSTATAKASIDALVGASLPEVTAKLAGYTRLALPSPSFDIGAQITAAGAAYTAAMAEVSAMPGGVALVSALTAAVAAQIAAQAAIAGFAPSASAKIDAALAVTAGLKVQVTAGVSGPNVNFGIISGVVAQLEALKATIEAKASAAATLGGHLSTGGITVYTYTGNADVAGAELQSRFDFDGLSGAVNFAVIVPSNPSAWASIQATISV
jgi:hypothetical protein